MAAVDATTYDPLNMPETRLRTLFAQALVPEAICKALADKGILTLALFKATGSDKDAACIRIIKIINESRLGSAEDEIEMNKLRIEACWSLANRVFDMDTDQQYKLSDDPTKIPEIPDTIRLRMRHDWISKHTELDLSELNEPHPKFLDRLKRDHIVHGRVPLYPITEIRVKDDTIEYRRALSTSIDSLLHTVKEELPVKHITSNEQLMNRIFAFGVALEFLQICSPEDFSMVFLGYIKKLQRFAHKHTEAMYLVRADRLVREETDMLMAEDLHQSFVPALKAVLDQKHYLWDRAVAQIDREKSQPKAPISPGGPDLLPGQVPGKGRQRGKGKQRGKGSDKVAGKGSPGGKVILPPKGGKVDPAQWKKVVEATASGSASSKICRFYNTALGCRYADKCSRKHVCAICGQKHPMYQAH